MADIEKVMAGLKHCSECGRNGGCKDCPYDEGEHDISCISAMAQDALELLEELYERRVKDEGSGRENP